MKGERVDLDGELMVATQAITQNHRRRLEGMGLDALAFRRIGGLGIARIDRFKDGTYQPTGSAVAGDVSLIWPVWYGTVSDAGLVEAELVDLLAWSPERPSAFSRRIGDGFALGMAAIERAMMAETGAGGAPLHLYRSPLAWAIAGGYAIASPAPESTAPQRQLGAVILDWDRDNWLFHVATIVCEDDEHAEDVEHLLKLLRVKLTPRLPEIRVPKEETARGAAATAKI